jgi:predicted enzyme related to lactoylglutathione lyase
MHKSRLSNIIIDCQTDDIDAAARFWSAALGRTAERCADPAEPYRALEGPPGEMKILVQAVSHPSRVHLDIETDDTEAEAERLERLGAKRVAQIKTWWVMEAPTGQRFCVVRPQRPDFEALANTWPQGEADGAQAPRTATASGTFGVQMTPAGEPAVAPDGETPLARMTLDKVFSGDMDGRSRGEMLTAVTPKSGSAGYVAVERFAGTVHGRRGSFVLQHCGTMSHAGGQRLDILIVPDSGSGELEGIAGRFLLKIERGEHRYALEYALPR